jgi:hypothetical protein
MEAAAVRELLGWAATAVFVGSYFLGRPDALRRTQMIGALMWVVYGLLIRATPVVAANLLVFGAAAWTDARARRGARHDRPLRATVSR